MVLSFRVWCGVWVGISLNLDGIGGVREFPCLGVFSIDLGFWAFDLNFCLFWLEFADLWFCDFDGFVGLC